MQPTKSRDVFNILSNIYDGDFCKNNQRLSAANYFRSNNLTKIIETVLNTPLKRIKK